MDAHKTGARTVTANYRFIWNQLDFINYSHLQVGLRLKFEFFYFPFLEKIVGTEALLSP